METGDNKVYETIEIIKSREFVKHLLSFENILPSLMAANHMIKKQINYFLKKNSLIHLQMNGKEIFLDMEQINRPI